MKNNPSAAMVYCFGEKGNYVAGIRVKLYEAVDAEILNRAVNTAIKRFPYLAFQVKDGEDGLFVLEKNDRPVCVFDDLHDHVMLTEQSNYHALNLEVNGKEIIFNTGHFMADGKSMMEWVKSVLYYYLCEFYGTELDPESIRTLSDEIPAEERNDPLKPYVERAMRKIQEKDDGEPVFTPSYQGRSLAFEDIKGLCGLNDYVDINGNARMCSFWVSSADFMKLARVNDGSPATFTAAVMTKILRERRPDLNKNITASILEDLRPGLGTPLAHHSLISRIKVTYTPEAADKDVETLSTMARGKVILETEPEAYQRTREGVAGVCAAAFALPDHKTRFDLMYRDLPTENFNVSYVGMIPFGAVEKYVDELYVVIPPTPDYLTIEINYINGKLLFMFSQCFDDTYFVKHFMGFFESNGIEVHNYREAQMRHPLIDMTAPLLRKK